MARKRYTARVSRGTSRKFVWVRKTLARTATDDATGTDLLSDFETAYGAQLIGCTIVRIRGLIFANASNAANTTDHFRFAARVTSGHVDLTGQVPDLAPFGDPNADWMLWEPMFDSRDSQGESADVGVMRMIDVKSSRKLEELGERFVMFAQTNPAAPTIAWQFGYDLSIGIKLP